MVNFHSIGATVLTALSLFCHVVTAQQYAGDNITQTIESVPGSEIAYFKVKDPAGKSAHLTLTNYYSLQANNARLVPSQLKRAVIVIHGLDRDPWTYMSNVSIQ